MKYLVTGGLGFIGSHLVEALLERDPDCKVVVVDNKSSNAVETVGDPNRTTVAIADTAGLWWTYQGVDPWGFDMVFHLASPVGPVGVLNYAGEITTSIVNSAKKAAHIARECDAPLIFVSTSEIYGGGDNNGLCSEDTPRVISAETTVRGEYAIAKLAAETMIINLCRTSSLKAAIVRPFNVAGPRQQAKGGFVIPRFVEQALSNESLTVYGDGKQIRAFTHVTDIVDGIIAIGERGQHDGTAYNLGNPENKTTIEDLATKVLEASGYPPMRHGLLLDHIIYVDPQELHGPLFAEAADKYPDATKAMTELGWQPRHSVLKIIEDVISDHGGRLQLVWAGQEKA